MAGRGKPRRTARIVVGVVAVVAAIVAGVLVTRVADMRSGELDWATLYKTRDTQYVLTLTARAAGRRRAKVLTVVDATRGKRIARARIDRHRPRLAGLAAHTIWLFSGTKLFGVDLKTLKTRYETVDLVRRIEKVNPHIKVVGRPRFARAAAQLHVTNSDGKGFFIDPNTFEAVRSPDDKLSVQTAPMRSRLRAKPRARLDGVPLELRGQIRRRLVFGVKGKTVETPTGGDKRAVLIKGLLLRGHRGHDDAALAIGSGGERAVIAYHRADASKKASWRISALRLDGSARWTFRSESLRDIGTRSLAAAWLNKDTLIGVARRLGSSKLVSNAPNAVFALDARSGTLRWAQPF